MSKPAYTQDDWARACALEETLDQLFDPSLDDMVRVFDTEKCATQFAAVRRERDQRAEKLAEALHWLAKWQHEGRDPGHCNPNTEDCPHHACKKTTAALAEWERSKA